MINELNNNKKENNKITPYGIIYVATNLLNNKQYVGQTTRSLKERIEDHAGDKRLNRHFSNAICKNGIKNFKFDIVCTCFDLDSLNECEVCFVKSLNTMSPYGYNHRAGGNQNGICSNELKIKISLAKIGKPNLKKRGEVRTIKQRIMISRSLGGRQIKAINLITNEVKLYDTAHQTANDGFNPSNVVSICKNKRTQSKGWTFSYVNSDANQNGSLEIKDSKHVQRLGIENSKENRISPRATDFQIGRIDSLNL